MENNLKKKKKELIANILFCGVLGSIAGVVLGNIVNSYLLSIVGTILIAEGLGLTVNVSLIKEIKHLKINLKQEMIGSEEEKELIKTEEKILEEHLEKKDFVLETPISQMTLYAYKGVFYPICFDLEEKQKFDIESNMPMQFLYNIAFIGNFAGRKNVIRVYDDQIRNSKEYYFVSEQYGYAIFNKEKSIQSQSYVWETCEQCIEKINIQDLYLEFQKRGIGLEEMKQSDEEEMTLILAKR